MRTTKIGRLLGNWFSRIRLHHRYQLGHLRFQFYTRQGCHLCEQAKQQLEAARRRHGFVLEEIDVDNDPELARSYGEHVPVITINGKVRFRGCLNPVLLRRLLRGEASR